MQEDVCHKESLIQEIVEYVHKSSYRVSSLVKGCGGRIYKERYR